MENREWNKGEKRIRCTFKYCKSSGLFYIINYISEYFTLVQFFDTVGNVSHAVSISGVLH